MIHRPPFAVTFFRKNNSREISPYPGGSHLPLHDETLFWIFNMCRYDWTVPTQRLTASRLDGPRRSASTRAVDRHSLARWAGYTATHEPAGADPAGESGTDEEESEPSVGDLREVHALLQHLAALELEFRPRPDAELGAADDGLRAAVRAAYVKIC